MKNFTMLLAATFILLRPNALVLGQDQVTVPFKSEESLTVPLHGPMLPTVCSFSRPPLSFERNEGHADGSVKFLVRGGGYQLLLAENEAVMLFVEPHNQSSHNPACPAEIEKPPFYNTGFQVDDARSVGNVPVNCSALRMQLVGANPSCRIRGEEQFPGKINYFIGNHPAQWRTNIATFAKVRYHEVYPGIDLVYYGNEGQLEYDFVIAPGADPNRIQLAIEGADQVEAASDGDLLVRVAGKELRWRKPRIYQLNGGAQIEVTGGYVLLTQPIASGPRVSQNVAFHVAGYDPSLALVIDPVLAYSSYFGGGLSDGANGVAVDSHGNIYVTGYTWSANGYGNFPTTTNSVMRSFQVNGAAFVSKFNPAGSVLLYSTVLTGASDPLGGSYGSAIAVDAAGQAIVFGQTDLADFPVLAALQPTMGGNGDAFVAKLSADGASLVFSTFLGGSDAESPGSGIGGLALDGSTNIYVAGVTASFDFPTVNAVNPSPGGVSSDGFLAKISADGSQLIYSTYLGIAGDYGAAVAVDSEGNAYVAGTSHVDPDNVPFLVKVNASGSAFEFSETNYLGGPAFVSAIALDSAGNVFLTGSADDNTLGTTPHAFQPTYGGGSSDAFVAKWSPSRSALDYLTYLGGNDNDSASYIAVDTADEVYVAGFTDSADFPVLAPIQATLKQNPPGSTWDSRDAFICKLNADGTGLRWSTYLGGKGNLREAAGIDEAESLTLGPDGAVYVAGYTSSVDFPVTNAFQKTLRVLSGWSAADAFISKLVQAPPTMQISRSSSTLNISWPIEAVGFVLESATSLPAASWDTVTNTPNVTATNRSVLLPLTDNAKFFRLRRL